MTETCADVRERRILGRATAADTAHLASCAACAAEDLALARVATLLAADRVAPPDPALRTRVLAATAPALAARRRHAARRALAAAVAAALLPLPLILALDWWALQAIHGALSRLLPATVSLYLVVNYAAVLALLGAVTYGAIPLLAERQARRLHEVPHG